MNCCILLGNATRFCCLQLDVPLQTDAAEIQGARAPSCSMHAAEWRSQGADTLNVATCCPVVLPLRAVASPHWVCMEAAVASPQLLPEWLGWRKCSPMQTHAGGSTTLVAASLGVCSQPQAKKAPLQPLYCRLSILLDFHWQVLPNAPKWSAIDTQFLRTQRTNAMTACLCNIEWLHAEMLASFNELCVLLARSIRRKSDLFLFPQKWLNIVSGELLSSQEPGAWSSQALLLSTGAASNAHNVQK